jgi:hypothetical protein
MDLQRFIAVGLDPKKNDFACCSFANLADASRAIMQYKKLAVTPILVDLWRVFDFCNGADALPGVSPIDATPNKDNPTDFRFTRWLVLAQGSDGSYVYDIDTDVNKTQSKALALSGQGKTVAVVSINTALLLWLLPAGATSLPARVDLDVSTPPIDSLGLKFQFVVAKIDYETYDCNIADGMGGVCGHPWSQMIGEYTDPLAAYAAAKTANDCIIYDRDNDFTWQPPWDNPQTVDAFSSWANYLKFERWVIEQEVRACRGPAGAGLSKDDLVKALKSTVVWTRRSGQTGFDRAKDYTG